MINSDCISTELHFFDTCPHGTHNRQSSCRPTASLHYPHLKEHSRNKLRIMLIFWTSLVSYISSRQFTSCVTSLINISQNCTMYSTLLCCSQSSLHTPLTWPLKYGMSSSTSAVGNLFNTPSTSTHRSDFPVICTVASQHQCKKFTAPVQEINSNKLTNLTATGS